MANIKLVKSHFVSFNENFQVIKNDIEKEAKYVYHIEQEYFIKGQPSKDEKTKMLRSIKV